MQPPPPILSLLNTEIQPGSHAPSTQMNASTSSSVVFDQKVQGRCLKTLNPALMLQLILKRKDFIGL